MHVKKAYFRVETMKLKGCSEEKKKKAQNVVDFLKQTKLGDGGDNGKAQLMCMGHKRVEKLSLGFLSSLKRVLKGWYE